MTEPFYDADGYSNQPLYVLEVRELLPCGVRNCPALAVFPQQFCSAHRWRERVSQVMRIVLLVLIGLVVG